MNSVSQPSKPTSYKREHGQHYGDYMPSQQSYRAPVAPYLPQEVSNADFGRNGISTQAGSRTISPTQTSRQPIFLDSQSQSQQRKDSQANAIAPSFQIPRSVNDSGGSLSELAAQITCLFWFESSDILNQVEEAVIPVHPSRQLVSDAKPTTGFRKWVTTILSTTLVEQNVVLLALLFVYRLKKLNPTVRGKPGSEYRLLTVALMLGNKFLDDNTYTNKTWAEVSGINVGEVHIMEVEFLSNMKYCLFTSAEDWANWQSLLGKFAAFVERAQQPQRPAPILPPASSLHLPMALPSPPPSNQASPPYAADLSQTATPYATINQHGPSPAPSPLAAVQDTQNSKTNSRKRSHEDYSTEPPPKRVASGYQSYTSPSNYGSAAAQRTQSQQIPRLTLPSLAIPTSSTPSSTYNPPPTHSQQLPPLNVPARAMAMVYPNTSTSSQASHTPAPASQYASRQQSPYGGSTTASPSTSVPQSTVSLHPTAQISPTYFLQQRNSPYRPVHNVSTLLYPPPSGALQQRPQNVEYDQMHYQPLGKSVQQRQSGRLPYVSQNMWIDNNHHQQPMTPVNQSPSFMGHQQHPLSQSQQ